MRIKLTDRDAFSPVIHSSQASKPIARPVLLGSRRVWHQLKRNPLALFGLFMLAALTILATVGPFLSPYDYAYQQLNAVNQPPSIEHWFGTDDLGRDLWVRIWWGTRISLFIGVTAALLDLIFGMIYGGISGYTGGRIDMAMQRIIEIMYSIPFLLIIILLMMFMGPGIFTIIFAYAITGWVPMARLVRGEILKLKQQEYVLAARTMGASSSRIMFKHLLPNCISLMIVHITFVIPSAIFVEAFLSFIGLGIRAPLASLGTLLSDGVSFMRLYPSRVVIPTVIFSLILLSFNFVGDGLRDALDPKQRK